jgi:hypothetical protein
MNLIMPNPLECEYPHLEKGVNLGVLAERTSLALAEENILPFLKGY